MAIPSPGGLEAPVPPPSNEPLPPRITVVEHIYYQAGNDQATQTSNTYSRELSDNEQPYYRKAKATGEKQSVDLGWIEKCGLLSISNLEVLDSQTTPSQKERDELSRKILEVGWRGCAKSTCLIPPGESMRFYPRDPSDLIVRSRYKTINYSVTAYPQ